MDAMVKEQTVSCFYIIGDAYLLKSYLGTSASCTDAFHVSTDTGVQVACQSDDVRQFISPK